MHELSKQSTVAVEEMKIGVVAASRANQILEDSATATQNVTDSLLKLTDVAKSELMLLNATAQVLRANIAELMDPIPVLANELWKHAMTSLQWLLPKSFLIMSSSHLARVSVAAIRTICNLLRMALVYFGSGMLVIFSASRRFSQEALVVESETQPKDSLRNLRTGHHKRNKNKARVSLPYTT